MRITKRIQVIAIVILSLVALATTSLIVSCCQLGPLPGPRVKLMTQGFSEKEIQEIQHGALAWERVGFNIMPINSHDDTDIMITVVKTDMTDAAGLAGANRIWLSNLVPFHRLSSVTAHEMGHDLGVNGNLPPDLGVMSSPSIGTEFTEADYVYICEKAGLCERY